MTLSQLEDEAIKLQEEANVLKKKIKGIWNEYYNKKYYCAKKEQAAYQKYLNEYDKYHREASVLWNKFVVIWKQAKPLIEANQTFASFIFNPFKSRRWYFEYGTPIGLQGLYGRKGLSAPRDGQHYQELIEKGEII